jgi:hypothetical protein
MKINMEKPLVERTSLLGGFKHDWSIFHFSLWDVIRNPLEAKQVIRLSLPVARSKKRAKAHSRAACGAQASGRLMGSVDLPPMFSNKTTNQIGCFFWILMRLRYQQILGVSFGYTLWLCQNSY